MNVKPFIVIHTGSYEHIMTDRIDTQISKESFFPHHWAYINQSFFPSIWKQKSKQRHKTSLLVAASDLTDNVTCHFRVIWGNLCKVHPQHKASRLKKWLSESGISALLHFWLCEQACRGFMRLLTSPNVKYFLKLPWYITLTWEMTR